MTKKHGNLFEKIVDLDNLLLAFDNAAKGKKSRRKVKQLLPHKIELCKKLQSIILSGNYHTSHYNTKIIYEPKQRTIYMLPFWPDRVLQHAIMNILEPIWDGMLIDDTYACRKGKGQHKASLRCSEYVRKYDYCMKGDISKFYPSINHSILKQIIRRKIKDVKLLSLLDEIIDSVEGDSNVPIGSYLSQWFGNLYMNELDMYVKHRLNIVGYIRYCDDFLLFMNDKKHLGECLVSIRNFLSDHLSLKLSKDRIFSTSQGIDFVGYVHHKRYVTVRPKTSRRIRKRMKTLLPMLESGRINVIQAISKIASASGWIRHAKSNKLKQALGLDKLTDLVYQYK